MTSHFKRLEFKCKCINISTTYARGPILWTDSASEFEVVDDVTTQIGHYRTWADNIGPEGLREARKEIEQKVESFVLGMRFLGNAKFSQVDERLSYIIENGEEYQITSDTDIEAIIHRSKGEEFNYISGALPSMTYSMSVSVSPIPLPQRMPFVPLVLKRFILNVIQAEELDGYSEHYADEQLKRWVLIVEELEEDTSSQEYQNLQRARDFVSHSTVDRKKTIDFLKKEIPSSVYFNLYQKEEARYLRDNPTHRAVVSKYQTVARLWAKKLIERKILSLEGGYLQP